MKNHPNSTYTIPLTLDFGVLGYQSVLVYYNRRDLDPDESVSVDVIGLQFTCGGHGFLSTIKSEQISKSDLQCLETLVEEALEEQRAAELASRGEEPEDHSDR